MKIERVHAAIPATPGTRLAMPAGMGWVLAASAVGFFTSSVFSWSLGWDRPTFVGAHLALAGTFLMLFFAVARFRVTELLAHWRRGLAAAALVSAFVAMHIASQPASEVPQGRELVLSLLWLGLVYGTLDGLFLNVMPVLAFPGRKTAAVAASAALTFAYHAGFTEYHGASMAAVVLGNTLITLGYVLTGSPAAALLAHVAMHVAAVLHGAETTLQLPPHY
jgi:hypothetical protein